MLLFIKKQSGLSNAVGLIIIAGLLALIIGVFVASAAIIGALTSGVGTNKPMVTSETSGSEVGGICTQSLDGHSLSELNNIGADGSTKISSFGSNKVSPSSPCYDSGDNGNSAFGGVRSTGCDLNSQDHFYAAVCPKGGSPCKGDSWWHNKHLIVSYNGKSVNVYVDDIGPSPSTGRGLDLSYAAIKTLGASTDATVTVCLSGGTVGSNSGLGCNNVPNFKQCDSQWGNKNYGNCGKDGTICDAGCGVTAAAMVLSFYGKNVDPLIMANEAVNNGERECGSGTGHGFFPKIAKKYGLKNENNIGWDKAMTLLKQGKPIIISGKGARPFTAGGHFVVLTCYNSDGTISVNDPARQNASYPEAYLRQHQHFIAAIYP